MDTTRTSGDQIPDGVYFVQADGCAWFAARFCDGRLVARAEESDADTHTVARDEWAGVRPSEGDELLDESDEQLSIDVALACGFADAYGISVSRPNDD